MTKRKPLDFDISVGASKRRNARSRGMSGEVGASRRVCEWEGCEKPGLYRAPRSRERLNEFRWFCLEHVREYNSRWNFYENMTEDEISESMQSDQLWGRQTWKMGKAPAYATGTGGPHPDGQAFKRLGLDDPLEALGDKATLNPGERGQAREAREKVLPKTVRRALTIMELDALATKTEIRLRYKELVKRFHPDQNGGDRSEEARLRDVLWAWDQLKSNDAFRD
ncbi:MAG: J domain-containing protein [Pseudomonadota bacterium]